MIPFGVLTEPFRGGALRRYVVELIGTFFLVLTVVTAVQAQDPTLAALAIGGVLMVMVYAGGHVSGAHYNPAVSLAAFLRGALPARDLVPYWGAQLLGALLAALVGGWVVDGAPGPGLAFTGRQTAVAMVVEFLFTFALAWVVLNVATSKDHPDNSFYGLAIGFTVTAGAVAIGPISGGAFNPAVAVGASAAGLFEWSTIWVFLLANLAGGAVAAGAFRFVNANDR